MPRVEGIATLEDDLRTQHYSSCRRTEDHIVCPSVYKATLSLSFYISLLPVTAPKVDQKEKSLATRTLFPIFHSDFAVFFSVLLPLSLNDTWCFIFFRISALHWIRDTSGAELVALSTEQMDQSGLQFGYELVFSRAKGKVAAKLQC